MKSVDGGEVVADEAGGWRDVVVPETDGDVVAVVNTGALLARWTNDRWRATATGYCRISRRATATPSPPSSTPTRTPRLLLTPLLRSVALPAHDGPRLFEDEARRGERAAQNSKKPHQTVSTIYPNN